MAIPAVFTWPLSDTQAISLTQNTGAAGNLLLNGNLALNGFVVFQGFGRTVSLTSAGDNSGVNFTITGSRYSHPIVETIAGPNADTVETVNVFDTITSISVDGAVTAVSAGTGTTGATDWFNSNYHATVLGMTIQVIVTGTITYSFQTTLDDVQTNPTPTVFTPVVNLTAATTTQIGFYNNTARYSKISITASNATGSLVATFLQQGIT
jgi:hypothetical protein